MVDPSHTAGELSSGLTDRMVIALRRLMRAVALHSRHLSARCGLTVPQLIVLRQIDAAGEITTGVLSRAVQLSQPTVTGILDRLGRRGLICRERGSVDRRHVVVSLTESGRRTVREAPPVLQEEFLRSYESLADWEQTQILSTIQRLATMMEEADVAYGTLSSVDGEVASGAETETQLGAEEAPLDDEALLSAQDTQSRDGDSTA